LFSLPHTSQPSIPVLDDSFKLVTHNQEITDLLPEVLDFGFRHISNTPTGGLSPVTHLQDGRQL